jgi:hypothetical protein
MVEDILHTEAFHSNSATFLSDLINDFLETNHIHDIIDIKYSSFRKDLSDSDYSALLIYKKRVTLQTP